MDFWIQVYLVSAASVLILACGIGSLLPVVWRLSKAERKNFGWKMKAKAILTCANLAGGFLVMVITAGALVHRIWVEW